MAARYLTLQDLYNLVGTDKVRQFFDDACTGGALTGTEAQVVAVLCAAEAEADSRLMRSWGLTAIDELGAHDAAFRGHVAWVALEFASERRPEFLAADGSGAFQKQYDRAVKYFEAISKGQQRSQGEAHAGVSPHIGGLTQPTVDPSVPRFIFAPDRDNPSGHGGFSWLLIFAAAELAMKLSMMISA